MVKFIAYKCGTTEANIDTKKAVLFINSDLASPGYAFLWIHDKNHPEWRDAWIKRTYDGHLFSSRGFKEWIKVEQKSKILERYNSCTCTMDAHDLNGPCISNTRLDQAISIVCNSWPESAMPWASRKRPYRILTQDMINSQINRGVLLVPMGNKTESVDANPDEWRISFALTEKDLIHSWNHVQMVCYACLKIVLKEYVKPKSRGDDVLTSYLIKTTLLWISEEIRPESWTPENLTLCFRQCINRLSYYFKYKVFPNYFIPDCNMIKCTTTEQSLTILSAMLNDIGDNAIACLLQCASLSGLVKLKLDRCISNGLTSFDLAVLPLFSSYLPEISASPLILIKCIKHITSLTSVEMKNLYLMTLIQSAYERARSTVYNNLAFKNKISYIDQRRLQVDALLSTNCDAVTGWIYMALLFYINSQYDRALLVLEFLRLKCTRNKIMVGWRSNLRMDELLRIREQNKMIFRGNFFRKLRHCTMKSFVQIQSPQREVMGYLDHRVLWLFTVPSQNYITCPPETLIHYLRFLCFIGIRDKPGCEQSVHALKDAVENNQTDKDPYFRYISYIYLRRVYELMNDRDNAKRCHAKVVELSKFIPRVPSEV
ncbi:uncharacterized protein LOC127739367 [Mytilus californianus]|uniref:uncharacterized protein LOC127739367 n=1 Tax=Mytilus californianus TaxID=6549 RepID=UPI002246CBBC|nr:uncharacterized protein LOC127739367 [Mytilus californianus]